MRFSPPAFYTLASSNYYAYLCLMINNGIKWIDNCDAAICSNIDAFSNTDRGMLSVNILSQLRNLLDHICVVIYLKAGMSEAVNYYKTIQAAHKYIDADYKYRDIKGLYSLLQISASHYTLDAESSERLMLKYYVYLLRIRSLVADELGMAILHNLESFPVNTDPAFNEYYKAIVQRINTIDLANAQTDERRYYIYGMRPVVVDGAVYYEVTLSAANENASKFDRIIAFTRLEISPYYAAMMRTVTTDIEVMGMRMPILLIIDWKPSIRRCEFKNMGRISGLDFPDSTTREYDNLMRYLRESRWSLTEIITLDDESFDKFLQIIREGGKARHISGLLNKCRSIISRSQPGHNILRYLLLRMNNKILRGQYSAERCSRLSNLNITRKSIPFDELPFSFSLAGHNPMLSDVIEAIPPRGHESEILARQLASNAEHKGTLYTSHDDLARFGDLQVLADAYNASLYHTHGHASIEVIDRHAFIRGYEDNVHNILLGLARLRGQGIENYTAIAEAWINSDPGKVDCDEKRQALRRIFAHSRVAMIYGAAGTGKSTLINHIANIFETSSKIFLANTKPAVYNLQRKVDAPASQFMTIAAYLARHAPACDILFVDECSTVCNSDMLDILDRGAFTALVLVGDMMQIESIRFGNWFSIADSHFRGDFKVDLTKPYRTTDTDLLATWDKVRTLSPDILEYLTRNGYTARLDDSIFTKAEPDEIILCLNYSGLYGINNINRLLQNNNPSPAVRRGIHLYKVGDPILFNDSDIYEPHLYNNLKGEIVGIQQVGQFIYFTLKVDTALSAEGLTYSPIKYISPGPEPGTTIVEICIGPEADTEADITGSQGLVPFQIAYAISIHKAQGLEYRSVKVVITHDVEDHITHNIFYTAITRTRDKLKIYWTPETEKKVLENLSFQFNKRDYTILKSRYPDLL